ncbi:jg13980 [Pararge aegeria aegeria]|uniref:Jg13980 protein n=1 Tax=Pararge aegeria aegeria TaxID=348720 RepID=A0A8S4RDS0_9NEOP|nr:jg13980 [Pararge aegeria aegeria]
MLFIIYVILLALILLVVYVKSTYTICQSRRRLDGKTAIVTGGTAGMGLQIAKDFANRGARVIIACPFQKEGEQARKYIIKKTGNKEVTFKILDLSSIASVRKFANEVFNEEKRLNVLVNNAGVCMAKEYITEDGLSSTMQINYFGHFLLTLLLLPLLKTSSKLSDASRIVNVTSQAHFLGKIDFEKTNDIKHWTPFEIYANSKLYITLFTRELAKKMNGFNVVVNNADPGYVATYITLPNNLTLRKILYPIMFASRAILKTPWQGAQTAIHVALDSNAEVVSGELFYNCKLSKATKRAYDEDLASKVWDESVKFVRLNPNEIVA